MREHSNVGVFSFAVARVARTIILAAITVAIAGFVYVSGMVRYIPNDRLGVLEKLWSLAAL